MTDTLIIYDFILRVLRSSRIYFQLVFKMYSYGPLA